MERTPSNPAREYLVFRLNNEDYALEETYIREIGSAFKVAWLPYQPPFVRGAISRPGDVILVLDLRMKLGLLPAAPRNREQVVVIQKGPHSPVGLLVDGFDQLVQWNADSFLPPPFAAPLCRGLSKRGASWLKLLDLDPLLDPRDVNSPPPVPRTQRIRIPVIQDPATTVCVSAPCRPPAAHGPVLMRPAARALLKPALSGGGAVEHRPFRPVVDR